MNINNANFEISAVDKNQYPNASLPEVALVGRSNVGKSSYINMMLNRNNIARTSQTPGKTREINFYNIDKKLYFVDLPGYGYAKVSKEKKETWGDILEAYLNKRQQLKLVIHLVDIRHKPTQDDVIMSNWVKQRGVEYLVLASKLDKISKSQVRQRLLEIKNTLMLPEDFSIIPYSIKDKKTREIIWSNIEKKINKGE
ncbi:MAG: YihA family ribosome biogenesis GTP-binding protein [Clostridiales bacterium]|nr:YihA family ribosome biogenesis GTP-binding protein [Clostridiales bacterium]